MDGSDLERSWSETSPTSELSSEGRLAQLGLIDARQALQTLKRRSPDPCSSAAWRSQRRRSSVRQARGRDTGLERLRTPRGAARPGGATWFSAAGRSRAGAQAEANLLFYGPPGTGKTEFAKTLGAHLGFSVQFVGETNDKNGEPSRSERLAALLIANAIGAVARRTILVFDEADDVFDTFNEREDRRGSKVFLNRLLERSVAPTIWIANDPDRLGAAIVRRMSLALRFPKPRLSVRKAMVARIAESHGLRLDEASSCFSLARKPRRRHRQRNSIRCAHWRFSGRRGEHPPWRTTRAWADRRLFIPPCRCSLILRSAPPTSTCVALADQVAQSRVARALLPPLGPSRHGQVGVRPPSCREARPRARRKAILRSRLDVARRIEKAIALAFEEAADLRAFLVFDEADLLLRDRDGGSTFVGGDAGQRDADTDGASSLPVRLHDERA